MIVMMIMTNVALTKTTMYDIFLPPTGDLVLSVLFVSPERNMSKRGVPSGRGALAVHVKEARNLGGVKANGFSDPFCKCYLLPDRTKAGKQKTDVVKKDCNPRWDHTFVFQVVVVVVAFVIKKDS